MADKFELIPEYFAISTGYNAHRSETKCCGQKSRKQVWRTTMDDGRPGSSAHHCSSSSRGVLLFIRTCAEALPWVEHFRIDKVAMPAMIAWPAQGVLRSIQRSLLPRTDGYQGMRLSGGALLLVRNTAWSDAIQRAGKVEPPVAKGLIIDSLVQPHQKENLKKRQNWRTLERRIWLLYT